jgi:hypothetical protein
MITRQIDSQRTILIGQEDHADLAAQFAAHWGNNIFARLSPYNTAVFAAQYHDSHFREVEADLPMDLEAGHPLGHRRISSPLKSLHAVRDNVSWIASRDRYAAVLVSMHNTGLQQNRYGAINSWQNNYGSQPRVRTPSPEVAAMIQELESGQRTAIDDLNSEKPGTESEVRHNYHMLQVFDLLSLYFCCDAYKDGQMQPVRLGPIPLAFDSDQTVEIKVIPVGENVVRLDPYPFDASPLEISVVARIVHNATGASEDECRAEFFRSSRDRLTWTMTQ